MRRTAILGVVLLGALSGCGSLPEKSPPAGVDALVVPTPSPDPADFVADPDGNDWFPLDGEPGEVDGIAAVAVATGSTTDWYAEDTSGNVWWLGRDGEWQAGVDGALAGLAMPAQPRVGDGWRRALADGVVDEVATVIALDDETGLLSVEVVSAIDPDLDRVEVYADGDGLVEP
ncbi:MAG: hypothetical protein F2667_14685 [Actinobacteria bacterium]|nr:hypothetical protein [Actinomycetota bacterium]